MNYIKSIVIGLAIGFGLLVVLTNCQKPADDSAKKPAIGQTHNN